MEVQVFSISHVAVMYNVTHLSVTFISCTLFAWNMVSIMYELQHYQIKNVYTNRVYHLNMHIDGLVRERHNSSVLAMELCLSCTNLLVWFFIIVFCSVNLIDVIYTCIVHGCCMSTGAVVRWFLYLIISTHSSMAFTREQFKISSREECVNKTQECMVGVINPPGWVCL